MGEDILEQFDVALGRYLQTHFERPTECLVSYADLARIHRALNTPTDGGYPPARLGGINVLPVAEVAEGDFHFLRPGENPAFRVAEIAEEHPIPTRSVVNQFSTRVSIPTEHPSITKRKLKTRDGWTTTETVSTDEPFAPRHIIPISFRDGDLTGHARKEFRLVKVVRTRTAYYEEI